jgi:TM2 domain-containing membrane protein YozV
MNIEFNCPKCGQLLAIDSKYGGTQVECAGCKATIQVPKPVAETITHRQAAALKNPGIAAVLSFFVTGLGQIYNGQVGKGICFMIAYGLLAIACIFIVGFFFIIPLWIWGMVDAHKIAERTNREGRRIHSSTAPVVGLLFAAIFIVGIICPIIAALNRAKQEDRIASEGVPLMERKLTEKVVERVEPASGKQPIKKKTKAVALSWHQIKSWEGSGIKDTEPFTIVGDQWRIKYSAEVTPEPGIFQIYVYKVGTNFPVTFAANITKSGSDTSYVYEKGQFYLKISSGNVNWSIIVEELR